MKYIEEYRDPVLCETLLNQIHKEIREEIVIMEVCGGHTMALHRFGIPALLPKQIRLLSGPGCPVCVTGRGYIDKAIRLARSGNVTICTYGDLIRVPGSQGSLEKAAADGGDIKVVFSPLQCLEQAKQNPSREFVFLGIGFETTAPASAVAIAKASEASLKNFFLFSAHKLMPPAMAAIIHEGIRVDGYLCPGHVSTIAGTEMYQPLVRNFGVGCVIAGFEPVDLLQAVLMLVRQHQQGKQQVEIQYSRAVKPEGNPKARKLVSMVFKPGDAWWRGLGMLEESGLNIRDQFMAHDASVVYGLPEEETGDPKGCRCGDVLKGLIKPDECSLYHKVCNPGNPVGACMVSAEGACQTWYQYVRS
ncbi:MAG: hydrogenase formation protein HypD [Bacteroidales bacterium]